MATSLDLIIDATDPQLAPVHQLLPFRPVASTIWRWYRKGKAGVLLPAIRVGRRLYSTPAAINAWCRAVTAAERADQIEAPAPSEAGDDAAPLSGEEAELEAELQS